MINTTLSPFPKRFEGLLRRLLLLLALPFSFSGYGQLSQEKLLSKALIQLQLPQEEIFSRQLSFQSFGAETLIVLPVIAEQEEGVLVLDAHLLLVDAATGEILAKYSGKKDWYSDAVGLRRIKIDPAAYKLTDSGVAYGIKIDYSGSSRVNPYNATELSLYLREGEQLKPVLKDFRIAYLNAETDTWCNSSYESHSKSLEITGVENNGFFNLKFTNSIQKGGSTDENCERSIAEEFQEVEILEFEDGTYKRPL